MDFIVWIWLGLLVRFIVFEIITTYGLRSVRLSHL